MSFIAKLTFKRGETLTFGLSAADPAYDGTETVTCDLKLAASNAVPLESAPVVVSPAATFKAAAGATAAHWLFSLTPEQTALLAPKLYATDAKVVYASGVVDYPDALAIEIEPRVTI